MAWIGTPAGNAEAPAAVSPNRLSDGKGCGRQAVAAPNRAASSSENCRLRVLNSCVRLALEWSVAKTAPPVRFHSSQASTVPARRRPCASRSRAPAILSSTQASFDAGNSGLIPRPVAATTCASCPAAINAAQASAVRRHCQIGAGQIGWLVAASQTTSVSRWLAMAMASGAPWSRAIAAITVWTEAQMSLADCSAQPGCGYCVVIGAEARAIT